jgi:F-type H+-transporting ATPase subunit delta
MNHSKISVRYAKALFELAKEQDLLSRVKEDMSLLSQEAAMGSDLQTFLSSPLYTPSEKKTVLSGTFASLVNPLTVRFLELLADNKREIFLRDIARNFLDMVRKEQGIKKVTISSAVTLDAKTVETLLQTATEVAGGKVELSLVVDPALMGGFIMRIGDQQIDASVSTKLKKISRELAEKH